MQPDCLISTVARLEVFQKKSVFMYLHFLSFVLSLTLFSLLLYNFHFTQKLNIMSNVYPKDRNALSAKKAYQHLLVLEIYRYVHKLIPHFRDVSHTGRNKPGT